jgi:hypothetical protein
MVECILTADNLGEITWGTLLKQIADLCLPDVGMIAYDSAHVNRMR